MTLSCPHACPETEPILPRTPCLSSQESEVPTDPHFLNEETGSEEFNNTAIRCLREDFFFLFRSSLPPDSSPQLATSQQNPLKPCY